MSTEAQTKSPQDVLKSVNEEIKRFEEFFTSTGESPLTKYEDAIVRTYLLYALKGNFDSSFIAKMELGKA